MPWRSAADGGGSLADEAGVQADPIPPFGSFVSITPVLIIPEPSLLPLLLIAGGALAWGTRRR